MIVLHGLKACDTCRKALKTLLAAGRDAGLRDLRDDPVTTDEVSQWRGILGDAVLNTRSTTWRGLSDADRAGDPVGLMTAHPALIKRPVIEAEDGKLYLGWTPEVRAALRLDG